MLVDPVEPPLRQDDNQSGLTAAAPSVAENLTKLSEERATIEAAAHRRLAELRAEREAVEARVHEQLRELMDHQVSTPTDQTGPGNIGGSGSFSNRAAVAEALRLASERRARERALKVPAGPNPPHLNDLLHMVSTAEANEIIVPPPRLGHRPREAPPGQERRPGGASGRRQFRSSGPLIASLALGVAVIVGVVLLVYQVIDTDRAVRPSEISTAPAGSTVSVPVVEVSEIGWPGELETDMAISLSSNGGTIAELVVVGTRLERGDIVATVDDEPLTVFYGDGPLTTDLVDGSEDPSVAMVETNLVVLGYDPAATVAIDTIFDQATADMVRRWQDDLGVAQTGEIEADTIVVVPGPATIADTPEGEDRGQADLARLVVDTEVRDLVISSQGPPGEVLSIGAPIRVGTVLYRSGNESLVAAPGSDPVGRVLTSSSSTVEDLERALVEEGFEDPSQLIAIDSLLTESTVVALNRWQQEVGVAVTGEQDLPTYVAVGPGQRLVDRTITGIGSLATVKVLTIEGPVSLVKVNVSIGDVGRFAIGEPAAVVFESGERLDAVVTEIIADDPSAPSASEMPVTVVFSVTSDAGRLPGGPVTVVVEGSP